MKNKHQQILIYIVLICLFLSACVEIGTEANSKQTPGFTILPTNIILPISSSTPTIYNTSTSTETQTSSVIPKILRIPDWMKGTDQIVVIVTEVTNTSAQFSFIDAKTDEQFKIDIPLSVIRGYFWSPDGKSFGLLSADSQTMYILDINSGVVSESIVNKKALTLLNEERTNQHMLERLVISGPISDATSLFYYCRSCYSLDLNYSIVRDYPNGENNEPQISAENVYTHERIPLTKADDGIYDFDTQWSPTAPIVAIMQGSKPNSPDFGFSSFPGNRLILYDATTGQVLRAYPGKFFSRHWSWSPDGRKILYTDFPNTLDYLGTKSCILFLDSRQSKCIFSLEKTKSVDYSNVEWSNDGNKLYFTTYAHNPPRRDLCVYSLVDGASQCLTKNITELDTLNIEGYTSSPGGDYFLISFGTSCSSCDYWGEPSIALVKNDGGSPNYIGKQVLAQFGNDMVFFPSIYDALWRPNPRP